MVTARQSRLQENIPAHLSGITAFRRVHEGAEWGYRQRAPRVVMSCTAGWGLSWLHCRAIHRSSTTTRLHSLCECLSCLYKHSAHFPTRSTFHSARSCRVYETYLPAGSVGRSTITLSPRVSTYRTLRRKLSFFRCQVCQVLIFQVTLVSCFLTVYCHAFVSLLYLTFHALRLSSLLRINSPDNCSGSVFSYLSQ